ncbi:MAG TPA: paraquat-inducible protein A, partial [Hyphomicrobiaceae bacterium]|nr:paraquat-inducible protein A [Hyphomicrobiaceae bacterium]
ASAVSSTPKPGTPRGLGGRRFLLSLAIIGASISLALGVSLPSIKLTKFYFFSTEYSLISTVYTLIQRNQVFLGSLVFIFSILLPVFKILYLVMLTTMTAEALERQYFRLRALEWLGKWSMHDVLVLALMIFFIKSQGIYDATSLSGVYFFTLAVVFMILAYAWLNVFSLNAIKAKRQRIEAEAVPQPLSTMRNFLLALFILSAAIAFALGIILPSIRFTTIYVWTNQHSIATIIWALYTSQEYFLCAVIAVFSVVFPFLKLLYLLTLCLTPHVASEFRQRSISVMEWLGRYSMTDVMVLALIIFYMNSSGYTEAKVLPGVYCFAASALMTMFAYGWANAGTSRPASGAPAAPLRVIPPGQNAIGSR